MRPAVAILRFVRSRKRRAIRLAAGLLGVSLVVKLALVLLHRYYQGKAHVLPKVPRTTSSTITHSDLEHDLYTRDTVHQALSSQNLGHIEFHKGLRTSIVAHLKAKQVSQTTTENAGLNVVVGVEYGAELDEYASLGWRALGIEPNPVYHASLGRFAVRGDDVISINTCAAGSKSSTDNVTLVYKGRPFTAPCEVALDDIITEHVDSLSIDIQGAELSVLEGAADILSTGQVNVIFAEYEPGLSCEKLLSFLSASGHVLFDSLWYGLKYGSEVPDYVRFNMSGKNITSYCQAASMASRGYAESYGTPVNKEHFSYTWLQNDIIAIPAELVSNDTLHFLSTLSSRCGYEFDCSSRVSNVITHFES